MSLQKLENMIDQITEELKNEDRSPPDLGKLYTQRSDWYSFTLKGSNAFS